MIRRISMALFALATLLFLIAILGCVQSSVRIASPAAIACFGLLVFSVAVSLDRRTQPYAFAIWVVSCVITALVFPSWFFTIHVPGLEKPIEGTKQVGWLISLAMFGMGATLTGDDFKRVLQMPRGVLVGFLLQFSIMPFLGYAIARTLGFEPDVAMGFILLGSCPGGVSSNVITYLAKGNVALSVTMTACTTLAAPIMTPTLVYLLAGKSVPVDYLEMTVSIAMTVVGPVVLGIVFNRLISEFRWKSQRLDLLLAIVSIVAICIICAIIAAKSNQAMLSMGATLLTGVLLHNSLGFLLGYWGARLAGLNETDSRTVAIEVGLQNGGMAANLAANVIKNTNAAIAPAVFAPVMNVSGSLLATWWSQRVPGVDPLSNRHEPQQKGVVGPEDI